MRILLIPILFLLPHYLIAQNQSGYLKFEFNADSAYVIPGNDIYTAEKIASGDSIQLNSGTRLIKLFTPFHKSKTLFVPVYADSTATLTYTFKESRVNPETISGNIAARYYYDANVMVLTDDDSDIYFNGSYKGTGFAAFNSKEEIGQIEIQNPDFGDHNRRLIISERQINYVVNYTRPNANFARIYSIFPGGSQAYKKQYLKAAAFGVSTVSLFTFAGLKSSEYKKERQVFYEYREDYDNATTEQDALRLGDQADSQHDVVKQLDNQRRFLLIGGILVFAYNIYDAFTSTPKGGYASQDKDLEFYLSQEQFSGYLNTGGTLRYNF